MPRLSIMNMLIGFAVLFITAAAGAFISIDFTRDYLLDPTQTLNWAAVLYRSAHGHVNLFAILHICFGLTLPYSQLSNKFKILQTAGLFSGIIAMGPGLIIKASLQPSTAIQVSDILIGTLLFAALLSLLSHAVGLSMKLFRN